MTPPEVFLWLNLKNRGTGYKFRRQYVLGPYIADFYCHEARLVVEVDGHVHAGVKQHEHVVARDAWLRERGVEVIRFDAKYVCEQTHDAAVIIRQVCTERVHGRASPGLADSATPSAGAEGEL